jgi:hypothetical protein
MGSSVPHNIGCDLTVHASDEPVPYFVEAIYSPRPTYFEERARYQFEHSEPSHSARGTAFATFVALLITFGFGFVVGRFA